MALLQKVQCPTCAGTGETHVEVEKEGEWYPGMGDKDLWDKYSHASVLNHGSWSKFFKIASFYRCNAKGDMFTINFQGEGGSWPEHDAQELKRSFKFLDRNTGNVIRFKIPV